MTKKMAMRRTLLPTIGAISLAVYLLLLFSQLPLFLSLVVHKSTVRLLQNYKRDHTIQLTFSVKEFEYLNWEKPDKEFEWKGDMYDVISVEKGECEQQIYCFKDVFETELLQLLRNVARSVQDQFTSLMSGFVLFCEAMPILTIHTSFEHHQIIADLSKYFSSGFYEHISPPPEV